MAILSFITLSAVTGADADVSVLGFFFFFSNSAGR